MLAKEASAVSVGAVVGVLLRIGCRTLYQELYGLDPRAISPAVLTTVAGPLYNDVISNIVGCLGMGIVATFKKDTFFVKHVRGQNQSD